MSSRLRVVLCWHMHQPEYRDGLTGEELLPWVALHAIKDYVDMVAHLEAVPAARAVVNFSPVLLEQIEATATGLSSHLAAGTRLASPLLRLLTPGGVPRDRGEWPELLRACLRAHRQHLVERHPAYRELADEAGRRLHGGTVSTLREGFIVDLAVWYHLAWLGESVRRTDPRVAELEARGQGFTAADCRRMLTLLSELLSGVLPRYRRLAEQGRLEFAMSPWMHPIVPLLLDFQSARESLPGAPLPGPVSYPDGAVRARRHLEEGRSIFRRLLGVEPRGCWPSEGAVSAGCIELLAECGFEWAASGEGVLRASLERSGLVPVVERLNRPWRVGAGGVPCFFRSDHLSDLIGFNYAHWHGDDAVSDLVHQLEQLADELAHAPQSVVSIILDGENAWEHYPFNGYYFLRGLYEALADHPRLQLATFHDVVSAGGVADELPVLVAGSWVHGTLATWIGERSKNRCWELLVDAKRAFDAARRAGRLDAAALARVERQLAVCEGSDWAWWYGDYNPADAVTSFDRLYRRHLAALYEMLGEAPPPEAAVAVAVGGGTAEHGGVMRRGAVVATRAIAERAPPVRLAVFDRRRAGVLLHPSSLPEAGTTGALGAGAARWLDTMAASGFSVWQVLPVGPVGPDGSPYLARSNHAGNECLVDVSELVHAGLLHEAVLAEVRDPDRHAHALDAAYETLCSQPSHPWRDELAAFVDGQSGWLVDFALFEALARDRRAPWWSWPSPLRDRDPVALTASRQHLAYECGRVSFGQFLFFRQWTALRHAAAERGIALFGDLPIYVAEDSVEVWMHRDLFLLDESGRPQVVAGVPPDYFSAEGQRWGNPLYRWPRHVANGFGWWRERLRAQLALFDLVRIDHFRGLEACWEIPAASPHARDGTWRKVPGLALLEALKHEAGGLPVVAEDLGIITPEVDQLRESFDLPGMRVLQFGFDGSSGNPHLPHNYTRRTVAYSGTHDNDTTAGWYRSLDPGTAGRVCEYLSIGSHTTADSGAAGVAAETVADALVRATLASVAQLAVVPLQDLLRLGAEGRMNTPGTDRGNWSWRFAWSDIAAGDVAHWRRWNSIYGRT